MIEREDGKFENCTGRVFDTKEDYLLWFKKGAEEHESFFDLPKEEQDLLNSDVEKAYRKGYHQGFYAARNNPDVKLSEVQEWRHGYKLTHPPGSMYEGKPYKTNPNVNNLIEMMED